MTGVLLVEDEEIIKQKLMNNVAWNEHGFDPVFGVENGLEALEILRHHHIDIMVTDIQMPKMNGMELIKEVKRLNYQMKIIVISGFAEFQYAQESIKLNVADYLLKPFASRKLLELALRLKVQLDQENAERSELKNLRENLFKNLEALREKFFMNLLNHNLVNYCGDADLKYLGLEDVVDCPYQVVIMEILENILPSGTGEEEMFLLNIRFMKGLKRLLEESIYRHFIINQQCNQAIVVFFQPNQELPIYLKTCLEELRSILKQPISIGVGGKYSGFSNLSISYREACLALQYRFLHGPNRIFRISDVNLDNPFSHKQFFYLHQRRILDELRIGASDGIQEEIQSLVDEMRSSNMSPESLRMVASNLIISTSALLNEIGYNQAEFFNADHSPLTAISKAESLDELKELLLFFFQQIIEYIGQKRISLNHNFIEEIRLFINENYTKDITLSRMATQYKLSPGYLSFLFTEYTGENFINYLTKLRIRKAQELLTHSDLKIYEIAGEVGYNDSYYFSSCFKRMVGITPSEYRDSQK